MQTPLHTLTPPPPFHPVTIHNYRQEQIGGVARPGTVEPWLRFVSLGLGQMEV